MSKTFLTIINNSTQEVIKNAGVTEKLQFMDEFTNPVPEGIPYHIHITYDKGYFYMTSAEHETNSIVIFRADGIEPDFVKYRKLRGKQEQRYLSESRTTPTLRDYENGYFEMYFARQANDRNAKIFEIGEREYYLSTPFYTKLSLRLRITGEKSSVEQDNLNELFVKESVMPGIVRIVAPLQYFKPSRNTKESVQDRLKNYKQETPSSTSGGSSGGSSGGGGSYS